MATSRWTRRIALAACLTLPFAACDDDDGDEAPSGGAGGAVGGAGGAVGGAGGAVGGAGGDVGGAGGDVGGAGGGEAKAALPESGDYLITVAFVEIGGLELPFRVEIESDAEASVFTRMTLRATDEGAVSDPSGEATDVAVAADGSFTADFGTATLPAAFSPTGSDVIFEVIFQGQSSESGICGLVTGEITTLNTPLSMSTFGSTLYEGPDSVAPASCESEGGGETCARMTAEMCPELAAGDVTGFESCGVERSFKLHLPAGHDPSQPSPVIFLYHGLGGSAQGMLNATQMEAQADSEGFILITPESQNLPVEWDQLTYADNADLAFFDDMVTCAQAQLGGDADRIYATGLSAGGLYSTYLTVTRPDVLAASAPMSGGLVADYMQPDPAIPVMVSWGGEADFAVGQDFNTFALDLIADLTGGGHFLVTCDHGRGHTWDADFSPWVVRFLLDHPKGSAEAYAEGSLPDVFPDFCAIP